jgi:ABC-2 type transport system permease protein
VSNILAIANKELRSYFNSPIAYAVIGFFAFAFGFMFWVFLRGFVAESMRMTMNQMGAGGTVNINQMMLRPLVMQISVIVLFMLPMVTMRTYAEEKRSGTIELLLTSPLTDFQIIMGKFLGAMALFASMLAVTLIHIGILFAIGNPEPLPILTSYIGMLLMGGCFIAVGLLISSMTRNQIVAGMVTFIVFLMLWVIDWVALFVNPTAAAVLNYLSFTQHLSDFMRGVIDTKHVVYYLSFIAFGLFLTARSVDTERWRG